MISASNLAPYIGFTKDEVKSLSEQYHQDFDKVKKWYNGYLLSGQQIYNPKAVVSVMLRHEFKSYWSETASYETIVPLINMNYDGLKSAIIEMLSGISVKVNTNSFKNDATTIQNKDDVLTYMIHLGYLGYDQNRKMAFVPNEEIRQELSTAVESKKWNKNAQTALQQIKDKKYPDSILNYTGNILLVAINYDKNSKTHQCLIESFQKD